MYNHAIAFKDNLAIHLANLGEVVIGLVKAIAILVVFATFVVWLLVGLRLLLNWPG